MAGRLPPPDWAANLTTPCGELPGEAALRRRETAMAEGVSLRPETVEALRPWAERLGLPLPSHIVGKV